MCVIPDSRTLEMTPPGHSQVEQQQMSVENTMEVSTEPDNVFIVGHYELQVCLISTFFLILK